jgi:hypothetical protein
MLDTMDGDALMNGSVEEDDEFKRISQLFAGLPLTRRVQASLSKTCT